MRYGLCAIYFNMTSTFAFTKHFTNVINSIQILFTKKNHYDLGTMPLEKDLITYNRNKNDEMHRFALN